MKPQQWLRYLSLALCAILLVVPGTILARLLVVPVALTGLRARDRTFVYWAGYIFSFAIYALVRGVADEIGPGPFTTYPIVLDRVLGFGTVPTLFLQEWYSQGLPRWWDYAGLSVYLTHYFAFPLTAIVVWRLAPSLLPRLLLSASIALLIGSVVHVLVPTVPPWMAAQTGQLPPVHRTLADLLARLAPGVYELGLSLAGGNNVSAMPSMHVASATLVALALMTGPRWSGAIGLAYVTAMTAALVYFGEHYLVDAVVGAGLSVGSWAITNRLIPREIPPVDATAEAIQPHFPT